MTGPGWLDAVLAAVMLAIAACCAARLAIWRLRGRDVEPEADALHVLMGISMAGMLDQDLRSAPDDMWLAVFAAAAIWFGGQALFASGRRGRGKWRCTHPAPHAVESAAMVYMLWPALPGVRDAAMAMPGMSGHVGENPAVALVLAIFMLGYILWTTDQLAAGARFRMGGTSVSALAPRLTACYKIVMSAAMGYMLLSML